MQRRIPLAVAFMGLGFAFACGPDASPSDAGDAGNEAEAEAAIAQPAGFDRFCTGHDFATSLAPATVSPLTGTYAGYYANGLNINQQKIPMPAGAHETMRVIPTEPFLVDTIRVAF